MFKRLDWVVNRGRRIRTDTVTGYLALAVVASFSSRRRDSLRHAREAAHREGWLTLGAPALQHRLCSRRRSAGVPSVGQGLFRHSRARLSKFDRVMSAVPTLSTRDDGAVWLDRLKRAALADEEGTALDGVLKTVASL